MDWIKKSRGYWSGINKLVFIGIVKRIERKTKKMEKRNSARKYLLVCDSWYKEDVNISLNTKEFLINRLYPSDESLDNKDYYIRTQKALKWVFKNNSKHSNPTSPSFTQCRAIKQKINSTTLWKKPKKHSGKNISTWPSSTSNMLNTSSKNYKKMLTSSMLINCLKAKTHKRDKKKWLNMMRIHHKKKWYQYNKGKMIKVIQIEINQ